MRPEVRGVIRLTLLGAVLLIGSAERGQGALAPRYDFTVDLLVEGPILTLDPLRARSRAEQDATGLLFEGLVEMSPFGPRGAAATRWEVAADSLLWTFYLDPGRRFGDGTPLRSAAVLAGWSRARREAPEWNWLYGGWTAAARDSLTLELRLARRLPRFMERLALPGAWVTREVERGGVASLSGTAPFRFAGRHGDGFVLTPRLDDPRGRPFAARLVLRTPPNAADARQAWAVSEAAVADPALFEGSSPDAVTLERGLTSTWLLQLNPARPGLTPPVRAALASAVDRSRLVAALPGAGLSPRGTWRAVASTAAPRPLPASERPAGLRLACEQGDPVAVGLAEELAEQLGVTPAPMDGSGARRRLRQLDYDLLIVRWDPAATGEAGLLEFTRRPELAGVTPAGTNAPESAADRLAFWLKERVVLPLVERRQRLSRSSGLNGLEVDPLTGNLRCDDAWPTEQKARPRTP